MFAWLQLYNVVVETEQVGKKLLEKGDLKRRVTIIPLNKIACQTISNDAVKRAESLVCTIMHFMIRNHSFFVANSSKFCSFFAKFHGSPQQISHMQALTFLLPAEPDQICSICCLLPRLMDLPSIHQINWHYLKYVQNFQYSCH